jgi:hypothetical protein
MFAVKVLVDDTWLYVTKMDQLDQPDPILFDTEDEAEDFASTWRLAGAEGNVKVVYYEGL